MHVLHYQHESGTTNFGDALGPWLWDKLLPQAGSVLRPDLLFLGIGTLLNSSLPPGPKLVFGTGAGYGPPPKIDSTWDIRFLRGLDTAVALRVHPVQAIMDPAALVGMVMSRDASLTYPTSLMPRWDSVTRELIDRCFHANVHLIDPRWPVELVLQHIAKSGCLLSEALHGAVVADALRIPWIPVLTRDENSVHAFKWKDWLSVFDMDYDPILLTVADLAQVAFEQRGWTLTDPKALRALMIRLLAELKLLRHEINTRTGPFATDKEARA